MGTTSSRPLSHVVEDNIIRFASWIDSVQHAISRLLSPIFGPLLSPGAYSSRAMQPLSHEIDIRRSAAAPGMALGHARSRDSGRRDQQPRLAAGVTRGFTYLGWVPATRIERVREINRRQEERKARAEAAAAGIALVPRQRRRSSAAATVKESEDAGWVKAKGKVKDKAKAKVLLTDGERRASLALEPDAEFEAEAKPNAVPAAVLSARVTHEPVLEQQQRKDGSANGCPFTTEQPPTSSGTEAAAVCRDTNNSNSSRSRSGSEVELSPLPPSPSASPFSNPSIGSDDRDTSAGSSSIPATPVDLLPAPADPERLPIAHTPLFIDNLFRAPLQPAAPLSQEKMQRDPPSAAATTVSAVELDCRSSAARMAHSLLSRVASTDRRRSDASMSSAARGESSGASMATGTNPDVGVGVRTLSRAGGLELQLLQSQGRQDDRHADGARHEDAHVSVDDLHSLPLAVVPTGTASPAVAVAALAASAGSAAHIHRSLSLHGPHGAPASAQALVSESPQQLQRSRTIAIMLPAQRRHSHAMPDRPGQQWQRQRQPHEVMAVPHAPANQFFPGSTQQLSEASACLLSISATPPSSPAATATGTIEGESVKCPTSPVQPGSPMLVHRPTARRAVASPAHSREPSATHGHGHELGHESELTRSTTAGASGNLDSVSNGNPVMVIRAPTFVRPSASRAPALMSASSAALNMVAAPLHLHLPPPQQRRASSPTINTIRKGNTISIASQLEEQLGDDDADDAVEAELQALAALKASTRRGSMPQRSYQQHTQQQKLAICTDQRDRRRNAATSDNMNGDHKEDERDVLSPIQRPPSRTSTPGMAAYFRPPSSGPSPRTGALASSVTDRPPSRGPTAPSLGRGVTPPPRASTASPGGDGNSIKRPGSASTWRSLLRAATPTTILNNVSDATSLISAASPSGGEPVPLAEMADRACMRVWEASAKHRKVWKDEVERIARERCKENKSRSEQRKDAVAAAATAAAIARAKTPEVSHAQKVIASYKRSEAKAALRTMESALAVET